MKDWIMLVVYLSEPIFFAGLICFFSYRMLVSSSRKFSYGVADLLGATILMGLLVWISLSNLTKREIVDDPQLRFYYDTELFMYIALIWLGALSAAFVWHCYALRNENQFRAPAILIPAVREFVQEHENDG